VLAAHALAEFPVALLAAGCEAAAGPGATREAGSG
jgi:hypothetical protein